MSRVDKGGSQFKPVSKVRRAPPSRPGTVVPALTPTPSVRNDAAQEVPSNNITDPPHPEHARGNGSPLAQSTRRAPLSSVQSRTIAVNEREASPTATPIASLRPSVPPSIISRKGLVSISDPTRPPLLSIPTLAQSSTSSVPASVPASAPPAPERPRPPPTSVSAPIPRWIPPRAGTGLSDPRHVSEEVQEDSRVKRPQVSGPVSIQQDLPVIQTQRKRAGKDLDGERGASKRQKHASESVPLDGEGSGGGEDGRSPPAEAPPAEVLESPAPSRRPARTAAKRAELADDASLSSGSEYDDDAERAKRKKGRRGPRGVGVESQVPDGEVEGGSGAGEEGAAGNEDLDVDGVAAEQPPKKVRRKKAATDAAGTRTTKRQRKPSKKASFLQADDGDNIPGEDDAIPHGDPESSQAGNAEEHAAKKRRRTTSNPRKRREPINLEDMLVDPGVPLDANTARMSDLIVDPGVGHVSKRYLEAFRAHQTLLAQKKADREKARERLKARQRAREEGRTAEQQQEEQQQQQEPERVPEEQRGQMQPPARPQKSLDELISGSDDEDQPTEAGQPPTPPAEEADIFRESHIAPQLRLGPDGEWILDEDSMQVDRAADPNLQPTEELEEIEERDADKFINSMTYSKKPRGAKWSKEEVQQLCDAISQFGYDFGMIAQLFIGRNRTMVKNKWKRIERDNPAMAQQAWDSRRKINLVDYGKRIGVDFSLPTPPIGPPPAPPAPPEPEVDVLVEQEDHPAQHSMLEDAADEPEEEVFDLDPTDLGADFEEIEGDIGDLDWT